MTQLADRPAGHEETLTAAVQNVALGAQSLTMVQALNRALRDAMAADDRVLVFGEDVAVEGGVFRVTEGLAAAFGENRCFDTPLAESAIIGIAVFQHGINRSSGNVASSSPFAVVSMTFPSRSWSE